jgi:hypothetical protein
MARDLKSFAQKGYEISSGKAVDMFPAAPTQRSAAYLRVYKAFEIKA